MAAAALVIAAVVVVAVAAGWDIAGWLGEVWKSLTSISLVYLVPVLALQTLQTAFSAAAWHGILATRVSRGRVPVHGSPRLLRDRRGPQQ